MGEQGKERSEGLGRNLRKRGGNDEKRGVHRKKGRGLRRLTARDKA